MHKRPSSPERNPVYASHSPSPSPSPAASDLYPRIQISPHISFTDQMLNINPIHFTRQLFDKMPERARCYFTHAASTSFHLETKFALCTALTSCTNSLNCHLGSQLHARIIQTGYANNIILNTKLIDLYSKCGMLLDAKTVFDGINKHDHVSWTSMISGFAQNGHATDAILLFKRMLVTHIGPNCFTFASVISACMEFDFAVSLHALVVKYGCHWSSYVVSALIDSYSKCGGIEHAICLYDEIVQKDVVVLNSMIAAYSQNLCGEEALKGFSEMRRSDIIPTGYTLSSILNACASLTVLQQGRQVHCLIKKIGMEKSVFIASSLIDMYSKCGNIDEARCVFDYVDQRNSILWTSMITGYAHAGRADDGLILFEHLVKGKGVRLDNICLTAVLTACNHAGYANRATEYFKKMRVEYGLTPERDQYACMVDLYGKTGQLMKAKRLLEEMPFEPNVVMLSSFLGSCRVYGEVDLGREAAYQLFKVDLNNAAPYVTLANIYAEAGMQEEVRQVRKMMREKGVKKSAGWSWTEVENRVHVFSAGDTSHSQQQQIYAELDRLTLEMMEAGYRLLAKCVSEDNTDVCSVNK